MVEQRGSSGADAGFGGSLGAGVASMGRRARTEGITKWLARLLVVGMLVLASTGGADMGRAPSVADLAWMTGSWVGPFGEQTLEENWSRPAGGTIACLVRITGHGQTNMVELILIEEVEDSLLFRVRQWLPGFVPRRPEPQIMTLAQRSERSISFDGTGDSDFLHLTYSRPSADLFQIDVVPRQGEPFQIRLRPNGPAGEQVGTSSSN